MATVYRENLAPLHDKISVTVAKEDYMPAFEKKLKEYSKNANIPGFRKGMVPAGMIKKMYGAGIFQEEVLRVIENELQGYLQKEKPEIFAQPLPMEDNEAKFDMNNPGDYTFNFEIGLRPDITVPDLKTGSFTRHTVNVTDDMVNTEIENMRSKAGKLNDVEAVDNDENVLNISLQADGEEEKKTNSVLYKYLTPAAKEKVKGAKVGDSFKLKLGESFEKDSLAAVRKDLGLEEGVGDDKEYNLTIDKIGLVEKRELDEDFFNEVYPARGIKSEDELKSALRDEISNYWGSHSRNQVQDQIYHHLLDQTKAEFPEKFLKRWMQVGGEKPKTAEEADKEYPAFANQLKWTLLSDKIVNDNKLDVQPEELREHMRNDLMRYFGNMNMEGDTSWLDAYIDKMMKDEKQVSGAYQRIITEKLFNHLEKGVTATDKTVTPEELMALQHNHAH